MSFIGFSQDLTPKLKKIDQKTHYCFTITQSKAIAEVLAEEKYNDSIVGHLSKINMRLWVLTQKKDSVILFQNDKLNNYARVVDNQDKAIVLFKQSLHLKERQIKRNKRYRILLLISSLALGVLAIGK